MNKHHIQQNNYNNNNATNINVLEAPKLVKIIVAIDCVIDG
jgi:hypothetical protein